MKFCNSPIITADESFHSVNSFKMKTEKYFPIESPIDTRSHFSPFWATILLCPAGLQKAVKECLIYWREQLLVESSSWGIYTMGSLIAWCLVFPCGIRKH